MLPFPAFCATALKLIVPPTCTEKVKDGETVILTGAAPRPAAAFLAQPESAATSTIATASPHPPQHRFLEAKPRMHPLVPPARSTPARSRERARRKRALKWKTCSLKAEPGISKSRLRTDDGFST